MQYSKILNTVNEDFEDVPFPSILVGHKISPTLEEIRNKISQEMLILATLMIIIQILDGILTGFGVQLFGIDAEGNNFVRFIMHRFGHIEGLFIIKTMAIFIVAILARLSVKIHWIPNAMKGVIVFYLALAILPWTYILLTS